MSFVDGALKTSAIVCMTAVTVTLSIATAGTVIYGPKMAQSIIGASNEISKTSYSIRNLTDSANDSVKIVNCRLGEICDAAKISTESVSEMLVCLAKMVGKVSNGLSECSFKEDKEKISRLFTSIVEAVDVITKKVKEVNGVSAKEINGTIEEVHKTVGTINEGIKGFFEECENGQTKKVSVKKLFGAIKLFMAMLNGDQEILIPNSSQNVIQQSEQPSGVKTE